MVSLRKLAELAGVSRTTVWLVMRDMPGVTPAVRARILALAEEFHYHPNRLAKGSSTGASHTIGYISEHSTWHFYARVGAGIIEAASREQTHVIVLNTRDALPHVTLELLISQLVEQHVDGIIIAAGPITLPAKSLLAMQSHDIQTVMLLDTRCEKPLDHVDTDEHQLARLTVEYLLHYGHQRIAYCGLEPQRVRSQAFYQEFRNRGLSLDYFIHSVPLTAPNAAATERILDTLLRHLHPPTAIICYEDHIATQLLLHAGRRGLCIPGDLSIIGCGNDAIGGYLTPALTTVEQHPEEMGRRAYALIRRRQREAQAPGERTPERLLVAPQLVSRATCGPPLPQRGPWPLAAATDAGTSGDGASHQHPTASAVSPELSRLLAICSGVRSRQELMAALGLHDQKHFRTCYLAPALASGYLERTHPDKPHSSRQRYRLTANGLAIVQAIRSL